MIDPGYDADSEHFDLKKISFNNDNILNPLFRNNSMLLLKYGSEPYADGDSDSMSNTNSNSDNDSMDIIENNNHDEIIVQKMTNLHF